MTAVRAAFEHAVRKGDVAALCGIAGPDALGILEEAWTAAADEGRPDFDRFFGLGQLMRAAATPGVEGRLSAWLVGRGGDDSEALDVAGCFLMGHWGGSGAVDEALAARLLDGLSLPGLGVGPRDSLIAALGLGYPRLGDPALRERVRARFGDLWDVPARADYQKIVRETLQAVVDAGS